MSVRKFRKKPVVIEAIQYFPQENYEEVVSFIGKNASPENTENVLSVHTLEGVMTASPGDWIIKGVGGEFYPCKPDIFDLTYEEVEE